VYRAAALYCNTGIHTHFDVTVMKHHKLYSLKKDLRPFITRTPHTKSYSTDSHTILAVVQYMAVMQYRESYNTCIYKVQAVIQYRQSYNTDMYIGI